jgi:hypothetical protein
MKVVQLFADDWSAYYVDGVLASQGDYLHVGDLLSAMGVEFEFIEDYDYAKEFGRFPEDLLLFYEWKDNNS